MWWIQPVETKIQNFKYFQKRGHSSPKPLDGDHQTPTYDTGQTTARKPLKAHESQYITLNSMQKSTVWQANSLTL